MTLHARLLAAQSEQGYTLIELVVGMALTLTVSLAAFSLLEFSTNDVARITDRVHVDQAGRAALENIMTKLHSVCVSPQLAPIEENSDANSLRFVSEHGSSPSFPTVGLHELTYTPASGKTEGALVEKVWTSQAKTAKGTYEFNLAATPSSVTLLKGVRRSVVAGKEVPIFRYYRYWREGDTGAVLGELNPEPLPVPLDNETDGEVAKVTVAYTVAPQGKEGPTGNQDRPVALEDSAIFRLTPASQAAEVNNLPCSQ